MSTLKQLSDFYLSKFEGLAAALEIETVKTGARVEGLGCWLQTFRWSDGILMRFFLRATKERRHLSSDGFGWFRCFD